MLKISGVLNVNYRSMWNVYVVNVLNGKRKYKILLNVIVGFSNSIKN